MVSWNKDKRFCEYCGKEFIPRSPNQVYCSAKCRERGVAKKQKERQVTPISANMKAIMEMVKDDPNYGRMQNESMPKV